MPILKLSPLLSKIMRPTEILNIVRLLSQIHTRLRHEVSSIERIILGIKEHDLIISIVGEIAYFI